MLQRCCFDSEGFFFSPEVVFLRVLFFSLDVFCFRIFFYRPEGVFLLEFFFFLIFKSVFFSVFSLELIFF